MTSILRKLDLRLCCVEHRCSSDDPAVKTTAGAPRTIDNGFFCYPAMVRDPWFDSLRASSIFTALLRKSHQLHREAAAAFLAAGGDSLLGIRAESY